MKIFKIAQSSSTVDLQGSKLTVYHRTRNQDNATSICTIGFMAGGGAAYGKGIYSTYNLKSSLHNYNLQSYGHFHLESKIHVCQNLLKDL